MQRAATFVFCLLFAAGAGPAAADEAPRRPFGDEKSVIQISADSLLRWQQSGKTLLDLQGNVNLFQGNSRIRSSRLFVWFNESAPPGILEVYAEKGASLLEEGKESALDQHALFRLVASGGLVLSAGRTVSGEPPVADAFRLRAMALYGGPAAGAAEGRPAQLLGAIHPFAERTTVTDLSEAGATITLLGNASVYSDEMTFFADALRVRIQFLQPHYGSPRVQSIYAEGAVDFRRGDLHILCQALYIDGITEQGLALRARVRAHDPTHHLPLQLAASAIREQSLYRFTAEGTGYISTSLLADPLLKLEGSEMQLVIGPQAPRGQERAAPAPPGTQPAAPPEAGARRGAVLSALDVTADVDDVPVLYWPYVSKDVRNGTFLIKDLAFGNGSTYLGTFVKLEWDLYDLGIYHNDWSDLSLRTDYYSARGVGGGPNFTYNNDARHGFLRAYYIHDTALWDDDDLPTLRKDRGEATLRDREMLGDGWKADLEFGYLSDRRFLYTYDRNSLDQDVDRETSAFLSHVSDNTMFTALTRRQINDFQNVLEEDSVGYHIVGESIGDTGLLWTTHSSLAEMRMRYDQATGLVSPDWVDRLDSAHEVSYPLQLGCVRAEPFVWEDFTGYNEEVNNESPSLRVASAYGVRAAANFYRTFDTQSSLFEVDRLRHILTPTVEYGNLYYVSRDASHYVQNDEIDDLNESHFVTFGLLNRLQTYRDTDTGRKRVDVFEADVKYHLLIHGDSTASVRGDTLSEDQGISRYSGDFIQASARWVVSDNIELSSEDNDYNTDQMRLEQLNGGVTLNYWRPVKVTYAHTYYYDPTDTAGWWHSVSVVNVAYQPRHSRWRVDFNESYDFIAKSQSGQLRNPHYLGTSIYLTRSMEDWSFSIGAAFNQGTDNSTLLVLRITAPGSTLSFGSAGSQM